MKSFPNSQVQECVFIYPYVCTCDPYCFGRYTRHKQIYSRSVCIYGCTKNYKCTGKERSCILIQPIHCTWFTVSLNWHDLSNNTRRLVVLSINFCKLISVDWVKSPKKRNILQRKPSIDKQDNYFLIVMFQCVNIFFISFDILWKDIIWFNTQDYMMVRCDS